MKESSRFTSGLAAMAVAAALVLAACSGSAERTTVARTPTPETARAMPPIDAAAPEDFETATFALG